MSDTITDLRRALERERAARSQAESLLQKISHELLERSEQARQYAEDLAERIEETQTILDTAAEGIVTLSEDGTMFRVNGAAEFIFGGTGRRMIGFSLAELLPDLFEVSADGSRCLTWTNSDRIVRAGEPLEARRYDGTCFPAEVSLSKWRYAGRTMVTAIVRDISHRQALETRLLRSQKLESVGRLAAGIAHEINSPVQYVQHNVAFVRDAFTTITALLDAYDRWIAADSAEEVQAREIQEIRALKEAGDYEYLRRELPQAFEQALEGTGRVAAIVQAMRQLAHPGQTNREPFDVHSVLSQVAAVARAEIRAVAELRWDLADALPSVRGYPSEFGQSVLNLLINAAHAISDRQSREPEHAGHIEIRTRAVPLGVQVDFVDNGMGIPPQHLARIFDPFFTTKHRGKGTGQGLAICQTVIVEKHQGVLEVSSRPGLGTTFTVILPVEPQIVPASNQCQSHDTAACVICG